MKVWNKQDQAERTYLANLETDLKIIELQELLEYNSLELAAIEHSSLGADEKAEARKLYNKKEQSLKLKMEELLRRLNP